MIRSYAVSIHDVAPATWLRCEQLLQLPPAGSPTTLLVVPRYRHGIAADEDAAFVAALKRRVEGGDDIVLHGYFHLDDARSPRNPLAWARRRLYTAGEGEFDSIDRATAQLRLSDGLARLRRAGLEPRGFVAPAWLLGAAAGDALAALDLGYTCSRDELVALPGGERVCAPSLVWSSRSAWRRALSRRWNARRLRAFALEPLLRVALHPADAEHAAVMAAWRAVFQQLAALRKLVLEGDWLAARASAQRPSAAAGAGV